MSIQSDCPSCFKGDHGGHDRDHGIRPGLLGGVWCGCTGDCAERSCVRWVGLMPANPPAAPSVPPSSASQGSAHTQGPDGGSGAQNGAEWLDAIEARLRAATAGPWRLSEGNPGEVWANRDPAGWDAFLVAETATRLNPDPSEQALSDADFIAHAPEDIASLLAAVRERDAEIERLKDWIACTCGGKRTGTHLMPCKLYVGPVSHSWVTTRWNPTFGGVDYWCSCGGWFRKGGLAGHGDGTETAEAVCPKADIDWQGPRAALAGEDK